MHAIVDALPESVVPLVAAMLVGAAGHYGIVTGYERTIPSPAVERQGGGSGRGRTRHLTAAVVAMRGAGIRPALAPPPGRHAGPLRGRGSPAPPGPAPG